MSFDLESLSEATSGAIGSLVSTTILYPLDTCKSKYQAEVRAHGQQKYRLPTISFFYFFLFFNLGLCVSPVVSMGLGNFLVLHSNRDLGYHCCSHYPVSEGIYI